MGLTTQLSARDRIVRLLDAHSFVEIGALVHARNTDFNMTDKETPADGVLTGYGTVEGRLVYVYSQDINVMKGSVGEMHAEKIGRIYDLALKMGAPVVGFIDSSGMRLQEATDALNAFGKLYHKQVMASGVVPQIIGIFGSCGGGMTIMSSLADFTFAVEEQGEMFMNSPDTLDGNRKELCNTASVDFRSGQTGDIDGLGHDDAEVIGKIRRLLVFLPSNNKEDALCMSDITDDLNRETPSLGNTLDTAYILKDIADAHQFFEIKPDFAVEMVTGFIFLGGNTVGAVANRGEIYNEKDKKIQKLRAEISPEGARKAADFVRFCDAFSIPVLTLVNAEGYRATVEAEKELIQSAGKLTYAYAGATVPKVTVIIGKAYGSAYLCMGSRHIGADMVYAWPEACIGMMDAKEAVKIIYEEEIEALENKNVFIQEKAILYENLQNSPAGAASRGYVDEIIEAASTRKRVIAALEMLMTKRESVPDKKHGAV